MALTAFIALFVVLVSGVKTQRLGQVCTRVDGTRGVCREIQQCLELGGTVEKAGSAKLCDINSFGQLVTCCRSTPQNIAAIKCFQWQRESERNAGSCTTQTPLVRNGTDAIPGEFPHMVSILAETPRGMVHVCGGSLIAPDYVLTAAHCIRPELRLVVRLGAHDLRIREPGRSFTVEVLNAIVHPNYNVPQRYNDIAILKLQFKAPFTDRIRPACLPHSNARIIEGREMLVAGWGATENEPASSPVMQKATVKSIKRFTCDQHQNFQGLRFAESFPAGITDSIICIDERDTGSCKGDSGGPLMVPLNRACLYQVVGLVSRGISECTSTPVPGLYTRVEYYLHWIVDTVWRDEL